MRPPGEGEPVTPPTRRSQAASAVRRAFLDLTPLRTSRQYRLLWLGELVSHTGRHITVVALPFQVWELTRSPLAVGLIGLVQVAPLLVFSLLGGAIADAVDRRRLLVVSQLGMAAASLALMAGAMAGDPPLWFLYAVAGVSSGFSAIDAPTRSAAVPNLVRREELASAMALNQVVMQVSDIAGPALGGLVIARLGLSWAYGIDAISFLAALAALAAMRPMPPQREGPRPPILASIREGFAYLRGRRVLRSTFAVDLIAMVFGMPQALFPVLATEVFHVGPAGLGLLYSAVGAGALCGALFTGWVRRVRHQGRAVLWAVTIWGLAIAAFGLSGGTFWLALLFLGVAGAADLVSAIFRSTILQGTVPDSLRGRLSSIHIAVVVGGPRLGDVEAGVVAQLTTPVISVVSGGVLCVIGVAVLAVFVPQLARYHSGEPA